MPFNARRQLGGEDFREYSHALSQLLNSALQQSTDVVPDSQITLRDQFVEGVRDALLRRELRKLVREKPWSTLFDVREEAMLWVVEDRPHCASVARNRNIVGTESGKISECPNPSNSAPGEVVGVLQEVVKLITQQGKAMGELAAAVRKLTVQKAGSHGSRSGQSRFKLNHADDGQPICLRCEEVGHVARQCPG